SCGIFKAKPPVEATDVLNKYFTAVTALDMMTALRAVEPAWLAKEAAASDMSRSQYRLEFVDSFNQKNENMGITSYSLGDAKKISNTEWKINVSQNTTDGILIKPFSVVKIDDAWFVAGDNFYGPKAPAEAVKVLDQYFKAAKAASMTPATLELIEPIWIEQEAALADMSIKEYMESFVENFNKQLEELGLISYSFAYRKKISDREWEIEVYQDTPEGFAIEAFNLIKIEDKWYISAINFYGPKPPAGAIKLIDDYFTAVISEDIETATALIDPIWIERESRIIDASIEEFKKGFAETFAEELKTLKLVSYSIANTEIISEGQWEIEVIQITGDDTIAEIFSVTEVGNKWYIAADNFYGPKAPAGATWVLDEYFKAAIALDMRPAMELVEPSMLEEEAANAGISLEEYKQGFATAFNEDLRSLDLTSHALTYREKISDTKWEIEVYQEVAGDIALENFIVVKIGDQWYISSENFE
ncbi:MAG: hypothetical protein ABIC18_05455, partial [Candidatus Omnitrophota bacterium]